MIACWFLGLGSHADKGRAAAETFNQKLVSDITCTEPAAWSSDVQFLTSGSARGDLSQTELIWSSVPGHQLCDLSLVTSLSEPPQLMFNKAGLSPLLPQVVEEIETPGAQSVLGKNLGVNHLHGQYYLCPTSCEHQRKPHSPRSQITNPSPPQTYHKYPHLVEQNEF